MKKFFIAFVFCVTAAASLYCYWDEEWGGVKKSDAYSEQALNEALASETSCLKLAVMSFIRFYQETLSGKTGSRCVFYPSCSRFGLFAVKKYGAIKGTLMSTERVLRCSPWACGYDEDEETGLFIDPPENESAGGFIFDALNF